MADTWQYILQEANILLSFWQYIFIAAWLDDYSKLQRSDTRRYTYQSFWHDVVSMDASVDKTFFHKSLTVKLTATDIFNTVNNNWTMNTYGVLVDKHQSYDGRGISLNIIYNFQPRKSKYKGSSAAEEELKRL